MPSLPKIRPLLQSAALLVALAAIACGRSGLIQMESSDSKGRIQIVGDARRFHPDSTSEPVFRRLPANYFQAGIGLGGADASTVEESGPMLFWGGQCFAMPPAGNASREPLPSAAEVLAGAAAGVPPRVFPAARYRVSGKHTLAEICQELVDKHGQAVFFTLSGTFDIAEGWGRQQTHLRTDGFGGGFVLRSVDSLDPTFRRVVSQLDTPTAPGVDVLIRAHLAAVADADDIDAVPAELPGVHPRKVLVLGPQTMMLSGTVVVYPGDRIDKPFD